MRVLAGLLALVALLPGPAATKPTPDDPEGMARYYVCGTYLPAGRHVGGWLTQTKLVPPVVDHVKRYGRQSRPPGWVADCAR